MPDDASLSRTLSGPEHQKVRLPAISALQSAGWDIGQLRWNPEWRVPKAPSDAAKREGGKAFEGWPVDLAIFDDAGHVGDWEHIGIICEFKEPTLEEGLSQLEIYLAREPRARMGFWTNGTQDVRVYKLADGTFKHLKNRGLPLPGDELAQPSEHPLTYNDLTVPKNGQLNSIFARLLDVVVARDSRSTRSDSQLNELCNLLLLKLESDTLGEYGPTKPLDFQLSHGGDAATAIAMRASFEALKKKRPEIFAEQREGSLDLDDHTIQEVVYELSSLNLTSVRPQAISSAFQIFRRANQLDDPAGRPAEGWRRGTGTTRRSADLAEDAQFVREHGGYWLANNREVAMRLGVSRECLEKALSRARQAEAQADREAG